MKDQKQTGNSEQTKTTRYEQFLNSDSDARKQQQISNDVKQISLLLDIELSKLDNLKLDLDRQIEETIFPKNSSPINFSKYIQLCEQSDTADLHKEYLTKLKNDYFSC